MTDSRVQKTDVIVIGSGIGGLSCAALLARYGFDVTVIESYSLPGGALRVRQSPTAGDPPTALDSPRTLLSVTDSSLTRDRRSTLVCLHGLLPTPSDKCWMPLGRSCRA